jgi:hypothetical protein
MRTIDGAAPLRFPHIAYEEIGGRGFRDGCDRATSQDPSEVVTSQAREHQRHRGERRRCRDDLIAAALLDVVDLRPSSGNSGNPE